MESLEGSGRHGFTRKDVIAAQSTPPPRRAKIPRMAKTAPRPATPVNQPADQPAYMDSTEAAQALGISLDALRKRIARGTIEATKEAGHWYVQGPGTQPDADRPDDRPPTGQEVDGATLALAAMEARIASLEFQLLSKDEQLGVAATQIGELHRLLAQTALNAAPARPWWKLW